LKCLKNNGNPADIKGICFKDSNKKIIITPKREVIKDLDSIPFSGFSEYGN